MAIYRGPGGSGDAVNDASSEASIVAMLATQAEASAASAASSASSATSSASTASTSATSATASASSASTSATNAASSASNASTSATSAAASATTANTKASEASLSAVDAADSETNAAASASAAATSATNAAASESSVTASATAAASSASSASSSATSAAASASAASTSETNAASSASSASSSASTATTQASNAATSATNAASSASAAATSETNAATSETNAASSASSASTSASNASTSATNAATSETNAATSAASAAASYDAFDDRYLGAKASDPTLDNDGNALITGALYFNTGSNTMKVYDGSAWNAGYVTLGGALIATNNLSDLTVAADARTNLGLGNVTNESKATMFTNPTFTGTGTFTNSVQIDGDLTVSGTTVTVAATNLAVEDNMIYLNDGSTVANPDLGIAGNYNDGTYRHAGFFRDATDGYWKPFKNYTPEPDASAYIDTSHASFALADIQAENFRGNVVGDVTGDVTGNVSGNAGTVTNGVYTSGSYADPSWITGLAETKVLPSQSGNSGKVLLTNGTSTSWTADYASSTQGSNADTAYGWGNHASAGYLTSYTETDPVYTASSWYTTTNNASNWDTAYGWGNHASAGYLTSIADGSVTPAKLSTGAPSWDSSGNLLVGTTSGTAKFWVTTGDATYPSRIIVGYGTGAASTKDNYYSAGRTHIFEAGDAERMRISASGGVSIGTTADPGAGAIYATGNITAYYSDARLKTKVGSIDNALDKVSQIETMIYHANDKAVELGYDASKIEVGVTAQSVQAVQPEAVAPAPIDPEYLTVRYERLVPLLIEAIKELKAEIAELKAK